jgi:predicted small metal-binding protein
MLAGKTLRCDCGYEVRAADDDAFVDAIRRHAREAHGIEFSLEFAVDVARGAQLTTNERGGFEPDRDGVIGEEQQGRV